MPLRPPSCRRQSAACPGGRVESPARQAIGRAAGSAAGRRACRRADDPSRSSAPRGGRYPATSRPCGRVRGRDHAVRSTEGWCLPVRQRDRGGECAVRAEGRRAPARFGITVDVRRHEEHMAGPGTAGNLSLVGWINVPEGPDVPATAAHDRIQNLLKHRFWRQQLAFDAWLSGWSPTAVARACDILIGRLADRAPVTVTELWRDDGPICGSCGRHRRRLPAGISPVVVPPALPPAGLTVGITRTERETIAVLRRVTRPGTSAIAWVDAMTPRLEGGELTMSGAVSLS